MWKFSRSDIRSGIALAVCCFLFAMLAGLPRLSSLLFVASLSRYNADRKQASLPFVLSYAIRNGVGPLIGYLGKRFGPKIVMVSGSILCSISVFGCFFAEDIITVTVLWGVCYGFGFGQATLLIPQMLKFHFSRHLGKAAGLTYSSECIMFFLLTPITESLLKTYELSGTFLILSGLVLHTIPAAMLLEVPKKSNGDVSGDTLCISSNTELESKPERDTTEDVNIESVSAEDSVSSKSNQIGAEETNSKNTSMKIEIGQNSTQNAFKVFLNPVFILLLFTQCSMVYTFTAITTVFIDVCRDHGITEDKEVYILMGLAIADITGRMFLGFITDCEYLTKITLSSLGFGGISVSLIIFMSINSFIAILITVLFLYFFIGGLTMIGTVIFFDYVDKEHISVALASRQLLFMPFSFTQAPLIGYFRDTLQSYNGLFNILITICCTSCIINLLISPLHRCQERREHLKIINS